jgi:hypothetical protein
MLPLNTILAWNINIIMNKKYDNNNIIIASRAYFLQEQPSWGNGRAIHMAFIILLREKIEKKPQKRCHDEKQPEY